MATVEVNPGVCGLKTTLRAESEDGQTVTFSVDTDCPHIRAMADSLPEVDGYVEALGKFGAGDIYKAACAHCRHPACPVPSAFVKAVEVACGLALPRDVGFVVQK